MFYMRDISLVEITKKKKKKICILDFHQNENHQFLFYGNF